MECDYLNCAEDGKERVIVDDRHNYFSCLCTWHFRYLKYKLGEHIYDIEENKPEDKEHEMPLIKNGVKKTPPKANELPEHLKSHVKTASKKVEDEQSKDNNKGGEEDTGRAGRDS